MTDPNNPGASEPTQPVFPTSPPTGQWAPPPAPGAPAGPAGPIPAPGGAWSPPPPGGELPAPLPAGGKGGGKGKLLAAVAAVVVLGGGAYASAQLLGSDDRGAGSPEEAVEQLIEALNGSDVLGVIDLLPEGERDVLLSVTDLTEDAERLGFLDEEDFSLDAFGGLDIEITGAEFEVEELAEADGRSLNRVSLVAGEASVEVSADDLVANIGDLGDELAEEADTDLEGEDVSESVDIEELLDDLEADAEDLDEEFVNPMSIVVLEEGGRFFPSVGFTVAEFARLDAARFGDAPDEPDLDGGIEPEGAGSPQEAVQALLDAATGLDAEAALAVLDPSEVGAAQVYAPLFGDLGGGEDTGIEIEVQDVRTEDAGRGGTRVVPTSLTASGDLDGTTFEFVLDDGCVELTVEGDEEFELDRTCFDEDIESDVADDVDVPEELRDLVAAVNPIEGGIITVERDGEHFVSPIRTIVQGVAGVVDDIDRADVEEGGILRDAFTGELNDEFEDFAASFEEAAEDADAEEVAVAVLALLQDQDVAIEELVFSSPTLVGAAGLGAVFAIGEAFEDFDDFEDFEDFEIDEPVIDDEFEDEFEEDETTTTRPEVDDDVVRTPTGAAGSGPNGELLLGDVVAGAVAEDGVTTFTAIGVADGVLIGAQATDGSDLTITVVDAATGEQIEFDDDFNFPDPEVLAFLEEGQVVTIEVRGFSGQPGEFVVYYEPF